MIYKATPHKNLTKKFDYASDAQSLCGIALKKACFFSQDWL